ncbi:MAG: MarR family transcriptional regulator [Rothia sp. (in: high G+C Gram-positive bacteria)]|nr:MarR family transcriptional regulator [Rothia sp. (in: high G+C Gram-positive bacteria)]
MLEYSWNDQLKSLGLTHAGVTALDVIAREGMVSQVRVASQVGVQAQTIGKTLARLEAHGHIFRTRNTLDRRSYLLGITEEGRRVLAEAENIDRTLGSVGELSNPDFREALVQIIESLGRYHGGDSVLEDAADEHQAPLAAVAQVLAEPAQGPALASEQPTNTAVMDLVTPELLAEYRKDS